MESVLDLLHQTTGSPWVYAVIFAIAVIDGFFPVVPSETAVITAGVFASSGHPDLVPLIGVAAAGAFVGDHVSYTVGRFGGSRLIERLPAGSRRRTAYERARRGIAVRGGLILVVARYVPGGRTAVTLTLGTIRHPLRSFSLADAVAAISWGIYSALIGYLGGMAFENDPIRGLLLGLGLALSVTLVVELVRWRRGVAARRTGAVSAGQPGS